MSEEKQELIEKIKILEYKNKYLTEENEELKNELKEKKEKFQNEFRDIKLLYKSMENEYQKEKQKSKDLLEIINLKNKYINKEKIKNNDNVNQNKDEDNQEDEYKDKHLSLIDIIKRHYYPNTSINLKKLKKEIEEIDFPFTKGLNSLIEKLIKKYSKNEESNISINNLETEIKNDNGDYFISVEEQAKYFFNYFLYQKKRDNIGMPFEYLIDINYELRNILEENIKIIKQLIYDNLNDNQIKESFNKFIYEIKEKIEKEKLFNYEIKDNEKPNIIFGNLIELIQSENSISEYKINALKEIMEKLIGGDIQNIINFIQNKDKMNENNKNKLFEKINDLIRDNNLKKIYFFICKINKIILEEKINFKKYYFQYIKIDYISYLDIGEKESNYYEKKRRT